MTWMAQERRSIHVPAAWIAGLPVDFGGRPLFSSSVGAGDIRGIPFFNSAVTTFWEDAHGVTCG